MFKVNNKNDFNEVVFGIFIVNFKYISHFFFVSVVDFEQVNVCWDVSACSIARLEGIYLSPCLALNEKKKLKKNL